MLVTHTERYYSFRKTRGRKVSSDLIHVEIIFELPKLLSRKINILLHSTSIEFIYRNENLHTHPQSSFALNVTAANNLLRWFSAQFSLPCENGNFPENLYNTFSNNAGPVSRVIRGVPRHKLRLFIFLKRTMYKTESITCLNLKISQCTVNVCFG